MGRLDCRQFRFESQSATALITKAATEIANRMASSVSTTQTGVLGLSSIGLPLTLISPSPWNCATSILTSLLPEVVLA